MRQPFRRITVSLGGLALAALLVACSQQPAPAPALPAGNSAWDSFVRQFVEDYFRAQPMFAVGQGRHDFDGRMADYSHAGLDAEVKRVQATRAQAVAFDAASLSEAQRFERDYLVARVDNDLFWLTRAEAPYRNPAWYVVQLDPEVYLSRDYAPLDVRIKGYTGYARAIPGIAAAIRANLRTPLSHSLVSYSIKAFGGFADFYANDVPKVFAPVKDAALQKDFRAANDAAAAAMRGLRDWFKTLQKGADDHSFALGPDLYKEMLHDTELVDVPVADIEAAGRADLERNQAALKDACASFAPGKSIEDCVARVHANKPKQGQVQLAREQLAGLRAFIAQKALVSIPGADTAEVAEAPPYNRANGAYINTPGPYEKGVPFVYNISPPDPTWSKQEQADYISSVAEVMNTTVHEVWPGHFLQFVHSNRASSPIGRSWVGYAFAEGWAHYCEEMMQVEGLDDNSPELHIAQLRDALLRDARLLSSIGLHTRGMSVAESERLFTGEAHTDIGTARQQAARGTYDPQYLDYTLGKMMIKKLRADWVARQVQGKDNQDPHAWLRAFHDQFLSWGGPPIPLVRRAMMGVDGPLL